MEDKTELLHGIREELERAVNEYGNGFSDLITGAIIGVGIADKIVRSELFADWGNGPKDCAFGIVAAIAFLDAMPGYSLEQIKKMFS